MPSTLRESLLARLDRLGEARAVAQVLSVVGREASFELLRAVSDGAVFEGESGTERGDVLHVERIVVALRGMEDGWSWNGGRSLS